MRGIEAASDWELRDLLVDPLGKPTTFGPNGGFLEYLTREQAKGVQEAVRVEFRRRGYSAAECAAIELGDRSPITVRDGSLTRRRRR